MLLDYLYGYNNLIIGFECELEGKVVGDKFIVIIVLEDVYGEYNEDLV